ncbi:MULTISPECIES: YceH family protein [unclassified Agarivorans]|uniref:YceH family protein n=1 Tax=unclassified Agarivorans TaxID=2636026 RepID=UPI003D7DE75E
MEQNLSLEQTRVIGALLEKETTTPDQYPLSLNALTLACNQKSNREPVMSLSEAEVQDAVVQLQQLRLVTEAPMAGRVVRYQHRFCNSQFGGLQLSEQQRAIICLLFLRGPQTPGELRTRSQRLANFSSVQEVEQNLQALSEHESGKFISKLEREPGKRESRYMHLFSGESSLAVSPDSTRETSSEGELQQQINALKQELAALKRRVEDLE